MNLVEKLMAVDKKEFDKLEKKELVSRQLSNLLGVETKVTIQAVDGNIYGALTASGLDDDGNYDYGRGFDTNAKITAAGIVEPNLKDDALLKHLGVATPADAAKKIFKGDVYKIAMAIAELSGFRDDEETDKEVKNSSKATGK
ncbi:MAG: hypothetical protein K2G55_05915 [Lachnospiraceae bacterium]|nr:hypothetical protein [Lachnospiraceae bacterium]MDE7205242.1 hypothetical protein [Lachnospiraceae bacterium]